MGQAKINKKKGRTNYRSAIHEAGHAVVMDFYDALGGVTIDRKIAAQHVGDNREVYTGVIDTPGDSDGVTWPNSEATSNPFTVAIVCVAGPSMEALVMPIVTGRNEEGWAGDYVALRHCAEDLGTDEKLLQVKSVQKFQELCNEHNWIAKAKRVAEELLVRQTLSGEEVREIVRRVEKENQ
jgi:hypothetical protein